MKLILRWILNAIALLLVARYVAGWHLDSFSTALVVSLLLGIVNVLVRPIILLLTLPINLLTLGLFTFVVNAGMLLLVQRLISTGFTIDGWGPALIGAVILWLINWLAAELSKPAVQTV